MSAKVESVAISAFRIAEASTNGLEISWACVLRYDSYSPPLPDVLESMLPVPRTRSQATAS